MSHAVRMGLIGLGRHGRRYATHLVSGDVPGAELRAFWRRDHGAAQEDAASLGVELEARIPALVDRSDVDALIAVVPAALHLPVALEVARARKPLLLEKPLARTVDEGRRICEAFRAAQTPLMVAQTLRFDPLVQALRVERSGLGQVRGFSFEQRLEPRGLEWEDDPVRSGGGVLVQTAIHAFDALRFALDGRRFEVVASSMARVHYQHNEDHALVHLRAVDDPKVLGSISASKIGGSRHHRFTLFCEEGGLEADLIARTLTEVRGSVRSPRRVAATPTVVTAMRAFLAALEGGPNPVPGEDALASLELVEAAYLYGTGAKSRALPSWSL